MSNSISIHSVIVGYKITSVNFAKKVCNVTVYVDRDHSGNGKQDNFKNVKLSSLLAWRLDNQAEKYPIGKWNCSMNTSDNRLHCPYQMIQYVDKETGEICKLLAPVEQRSSYTPTYYDAFGNKMHGDVRFRFHKAEYYTRWRNTVKS